MTAPMTLNNSVLRRTTLNHVGRPIAAAAVIVTAAVFVYRGAIDAYFFDDDFQWLVGSWSFDVWNLVDIAERSHFLRPIIELYFAVATPVFGGSPVLFHGASIALHAANGLLLFALAREISGRLAYAFLAALFFVVQPADIDAVAWVGAIAEPLGAFFGCLAILGMLKFRRTSRQAWSALTRSAFLLALLTHESSVVFLPLMMLADWTFVDGPSDARAQNWNNFLRPYAPYALLLTVYLAVDAQINSRNYVVTEGSYRVGFHAVTNALEYAVALYVGRRDAANYTLIAIGLPLLLLRGHSRARFATTWVVLALLPFVFFTSGTASRYLYLPAMGFSMLLADGLMSIDRLLAPRVSARSRTAVITLLATALVARLMVFAVANVQSFSNRTEVYREYAVRFKQIHGDMPSYSRVKSDVRPRIDHEHRFINALIQWEYRDPTIEVIPDAR
jgi:hypothetical protein